MSILTRMAGLFSNTACHLGLEGIVSKRLDAPYRSGLSKTWLKSKNPLSPAVRREREEEWRRSSRRGIHCRSGNRAPVMEMGICVGGELAEITNLGIDRRDRWGDALDVNLIAFGAFKGAQFKAAPVVRSALSSGTCGRCYSCFADQPL